MARVQLYEPQIRPAGSGEGGYRAGDFSSNIGEGVASLSRPLMQKAENKVIEIERQRQIDRTRLTANYFDMTANVDRDIQTARDNLADGAEGYGTQVRTALDTHTAAFLGTIADPELRNEFRARVAGYRAQTFKTEQTFASTERQQSMGTNTTRAIDTASNQISTTPTPEILRSTRDTLYGLIDNQSDIPQPLRNQLRQRINNSTAASYLTGLGEQNPQAALDTVSSGIFDADLTTEQRRAFVDRFQAEIHAREAEARRVQSAAQAQLRETIQGMDRRIESGDLPADSELEALAQQAQAAGLPNEVFDLNRYRVRVNTRRQYQHSTSLELRQAVGQTEERIAQAGDRATLDDRVRLTTLQEMLTGRTQLEGSDPLRVAQQDGVAVGQVDFGNPASLRTRDQAARTAARRYGRYQFFNQQEATRMSALLESGPSGRLQIANNLSALSIINPEGADLAARQIAPNDRALRVAIRLNDVTRTMVLSGQEARRQLPNMQVNGQAISFDNVTQQFFQTNIAPQLRGVPQEYVNDVLEAARALYAERARRSGNLGNTGFDQGAFGESVSDVLGRTNRGGGTGFWNYGTIPGVRGQGVVLPTQMNQQQFDRVMTLLPIARLREGWPDHSTPNGAPRYRDGTVPSVDDIRGRFVPVMAGDGRYMFRGPDGGYLGSQSGRTRPFVLDVYVLAAHPPARVAHPAPLTAAQRAEQERMRRETDQLVNPYRHGGPTEAEWGE